jgi:hypothetical protein
MYFDFLGVARVLKLLNARQNLYHLALSPAQITEYNLLHLVNIFFPLPTKLHRHSLRQTEQL